MKRYGSFLITIVVVALTISITTGDAEAARLGGGKSFGMSRNSSTIRQAAPPPKPAQNASPASAPAAPATPTPAPASGMSRWLGPIAGLAAGIGLAAMLSHFGMSEGVANFMMIALLAMAAVFLFRWLMRKREPELSAQYAGGAQPISLREAAPSPQPSPARGEGVSSPVGAGDTPSNQTNSAASIPDGFDVAGFIRQAKLNFVRLQAANDRGDLDDIRQFTAPEVFAEIQMQLQERGKAGQQTDVVHLEAELLRVDTEDSRFVASVRFFGQLREEANSAPQAFEEVWHLTKPTDGSRGWQIAGIQQLS